MDGNSFLEDLSVVTSSTPVVMKKSNLRRRLGNVSGKICSPVVLKYENDQKRKRKTTTGQRASFIEEPLVITLNDVNNPQRPSTSSSSTDVSIEFVRIVDRGPFRRTRKLDDSRGGRRGKGRSNRSFRKSNKNASVKTITKYKRRSITQLLKKDRSFTRTPKRLNQRRNPIPQQTRPGMNANVFDPDAKPNFKFSNLPTSQSQTVRFGYSSASTTSTSRKLRPIAIDGSNIAFEHGKQNRTRHPFSTRGIDICVDFFKRRGHGDIKVFLPRYRIKIGQSDDQGALKRMENNGMLVLTPSREINGQTISSYDDRFIVQYAGSSGAVVVSNDNYRDLMSESLEMRKTVEERLLMYNFVNHVFMVPDDPLGRYGPRLQKFL